MTRGPAQAGNRASRTGRYLQWWDTGPECNAVTPAVCKVHNSTLIFAHRRFAMPQPNYARQGGMLDAKSTPVGFEPTRGDPIGLAGRRLNHLAKVSCSIFLYTEHAAGFREIVANSWIQPVRN